MRQNQPLESREYHINKSILAYGHKGYMWQRTDGLADVYTCSLRFTSIIACIESIKSNARKQGYKPLIIR